MQPSLLIADSPQQEPRTRQRDSLAGKGHLNWTFNYNVAFKKPAEELHLLCRVFNLKTGPSLNKQSSSSSRMSWSDDDVTARLERGSRRGMINDKMHSESLIQL